MHTENSAVEAQATAELAGGGGASSRVTVLACVQRSTAAARSLALRFFATRSHCVKQRPR